MLANGLAITPTHHAPLQAETHGLGGQRAAFPGSRRHGANGVPWNIACPKTVLFNGTADASGESQTGLSRAIHWC